MSDAQKWGNDLALKFHLAMSELQMSDVEGQYTDDAEGRLILHGDAFASMIARGEIGVVIK